MEIRLVEIAEYAAFTDDKRIIVSGIFTGITAQRNPNPPPGAADLLPMPQSYLVWIVEASLAEGLKHRVGLVVRNEDGELVLEQRDLGAMEFTLDKGGRPLRFQGRMALTGIPLPGEGIYEFHLVVDGNPLGFTTLYVDVTG